MVICICGKSHTGHTICSDFNPTPENEMDVYIDVVLNFQPKLVRTITLRIAERRKATPGE